MIINHQSFKNWNKIKNLTFGKSLEICIFKNILRLVRFLTTLDRNLTRMVKKMIRVVRNLTNHGFLVQFMIYLFMDLVIFILIYEGHIHTYHVHNIFVYGKGKRTVHLNFFQHLFLKLLELTFISNQEISINPFLSEK